MDFNIWGYIIFAFVTAITPGPNNILLFSTGKKFGIKKSFLTMAGIAFGFSLLLLLSGYGISTIVAQNYLISFILKIISSLWLLYLAFLVNNLSLVNSDSFTQPISFVQAGMIQFINPKAWIMAINGANAFLPNYDSIHLNVGIFVLIFIMVGIPCMFIWVFFGNFLSKIISSKKANKILGFVLSGLIILSIISIWI